jgi:NAD(P)-dependent dehydrogenase (short-subunit alcohol dehydrogenase family)
MGSASLAGRTAAVTGGARGIGRATAEALVGQGMKVAIGDVDAEGAREAAGSLGEVAVGLPLDVRHPDSFLGFLEDAEQRLGPIDVLVNNAGIMSIGAFVEEDEATARRMVEVNAYGVLIGTKLAAARMARRGGGHVVNVASAAGRVGFPGGATYCATKFFVVGLSEALHAELGDTGVHVSCVMPGVVDTELISGLDIPGFVRPTEPAQVAETILRLVRTGGHAAFVPRSIGYTSRLTRLFPRRVVEAAGRVVGADRVLFEHDRAARRDYNERVVKHTNQTVSKDEGRR